MKSQLTPGILDSTLNPVFVRADTGYVTPLLVAPYLLFWVALLRALLVRAQVLRPLCPRCGRKYERDFLGEPICSCGSTA
jgi:hypothetical protein